MIDKLKQDVIRFLQQRRMGQLALSSPDGPWASVVRFINTGLTLYLIEPRACDLVYLVENDPRTVLTVSNVEANQVGVLQKSVQIFGTARILTAHELSTEADEVQTAYSLKNRRAPDAYVVVMVEPRRIHRLIHDNDTLQRDTLDLNPA